MFDEASGRLLILVPLAPAAVFSALELIVSAVVACALRVGHPTPQGRGIAIAFAIHAVTWDVVQEGHPSHYPRDLLIRSDLADQANFLTLAPITYKRRRFKKDLGREFHAERLHIFVATFLDLA